MRLAEQTWERAVVPHQAGQDLPRELDGVCDLNHMDGVLEGALCARKAAGEGATEPGGDGGEVGADVAAVFLSVAPGSIFTTAIPTLVPARSRRGQQRGEHLPLGSHSLVHPGEGVADEPPGVALVQSDARRRGGHEGVHHGTHEGALAGLEDGRARRGEEGCALAEGAEGAGEDGEVGGVGFPNLDARDHAERKVQSHAERGVLVAGYVGQDLECRLVALAAEQGVGAPSDAAEAIQRREELLRLPTLRVRPRLERGLVRVRELVVAQECGQLGPARLELLALLAEALGRRPQRRGPPLGLIQQSARLLKLIRDRLHLPLDLQHRVLHGRALREEVPGRLQRARLQLGPQRPRPALRFATGTARRSGGARIDQSRARGPTRSAGWPCTGAAPRRTSGPRRPSNERIASSSAGASERVAVCEGARHKQRRGRVVHHRRTRPQRCSPPKARRGRH